MGAIDVHSSQESTIPAVNEGELEDLRWTTGVPCHMMDVFRANPFAMGLPRATNPAPSSIDNPLILIAPSTRERSTFSPLTGPSKKGRTVQNEPAFSLLLFYRFLRLGPKKCLRTSLDWIFRTGVPAFRVLMTISKVEICLHPIRPSRALDNGYPSLIPRPMVTYSPEDTSARFPVDYGDERLSLLPQLPYPCSHTASIPQKTRSELRSATPLPSLSPFGASFDPNIIAPWRSIELSCPRYSARTGGIPTTVRRTRAWFSTTGYAYAGHTGEFASLPPFCCAFSPVNTKAAVCVSSLPSRFPTSEWPCSAPQMARSRGELDKGPDALSSARPSLAEGPSHGVKSTRRTGCGARTIIQPRQPLAKHNFRIVIHFVHGSARGPSSAGRTCKHAFLLVMCVMMMEIFISR
jgi:hypothetical protein